MHNLDYSLWVFLWVWLHYDEMDEPGKGKKSVVAK